MHRLARGRRVGVLKNPMPANFLSVEQERAYGRLFGEPTAAQLARFFHLDDADRAFVGSRRGAHMRLGCALQLSTMRFLGISLENPAAVPAGAVAFLAQQLDVRSPLAPTLAAYRGESLALASPARHPPPLRLPRVQRRSRALPIAPLALRPVLDGHGAARRAL